MMSIDIHVNGEKIEYENLGKVIVKFKGDSEFYTIMESLKFLQRSLQNQYKENLKRG